MPLEEAGDADDDASSARRTGGSRSGWRRKRGGREEEERRKRGGREGEERRPEKDAPPLHAGCSRSGWRAPPLDDGVAELKSGSTAPAARAPLLREASLEDGVLELLRPEKRMPHRACRAPPPTLHVDLIHGLFHTVIITYTIIIADTGA
jgi:hypothetical protein